MHCFVLLHGLLTARVAVRCGICVCVCVCACVRTCNELIVSLTIKDTQDHHRFPGLVADQLSIVELLL
jgi:hypothetical protein